MTASARDYVPSAFRWPPHPSFTVLDSRGRLLFYEERSPRLDLADMLYLHWDRRSRFVMLSIRSGGRSWKTWTEPRLRHVEDLIRHDLTFDGISVSVERVTTQRWRPCTTEFWWKLWVTC